MGNCYGIKYRRSSRENLKSSNNESSSSGPFSKVINSSLASSSIGSSSTTASSSWNDLSYSQPIPSHLHCFSLSELKSATRSFRPDTLLGEGGFGPVFKGWIDMEQGMKATKPGTGTTVAVKKLNPRSMQGHKEFLAEVHLLGQLHHPNLVKLLGYCLEEENRLLVYEYMPRGSLDNHLFRRGSEPMSWKIRLQAILDAAKGLTFLHEMAVIYRDFKTSNILLDSEYNAKLSDFGLAKGGPSGNRTHVSTLVRGTQGYAAPEYVASGHLTVKCDIYSFGVVLLEVLTGRRAMDKNQPPAEQNLVDWVRPYLREKKKISQVLDLKLNGQISLKVAQDLGSLALACIRLTPRARPEMKQILEALEAME